MDHTSQATHAEAWQGARRQLHRLRSARQVTEPMEALTWLEQTIAKSKAAQTLLDVAKSELGQSTRHNRPHFRVGLIVDPWDYAQVIDVVGVAEVFLNIAANEQALELIDRAAALLSEQIATHEAQRAKLR